LYTLYY